MDKSQPFAVLLCGVVSNAPCITAVAVLIDEPESLTHNMQLS